MRPAFAHHPNALTAAELLADGMLCFCAFLLAWPSTAAAGPMSATLMPAGAFAIVMSMLYACLGVYRRGTQDVRFRTLLVRALLAVAAGSSLAYLVLAAEGRENVASHLLLQVAPVLIGGVVLVRGAAYIARRAAVGAPRALIIGTGSEARALAQSLASAGRARRHVVGFYPTEPGITEMPAGCAPLVAANLPLDKLADKLGVDEVIVAVREQRGGGVPMDQLLACKVRGIRVSDLAGFYESASGEVPTDTLKASWLVYGGGFVQSRLRRIVKRSFDLVASSLLLLLALPVIAVAAIAIRLESRGPVLYRQERVGLGGRTFMCIKLRSMRNDAEKDGVARWATTNDARITRVGALIRKTRIDELPQLVSVLKGEMSLVGPRPERPTFVEELRQQIPYYDLRHSVKPGVTGWAQVRFSYGASLEDARRKHQFDLYYVKNNSLLLDLLILVETVSVVLFREGAR